MRLTGTTRFSSGINFTGLFLSVCLTGSCAAPSTPPASALSGGKTIGIVSIAADYLRVGFVGGTVFDDTHHYENILRWKLDDVIEADILKSSSRADIKLISVTYDRVALFRAYDTRDLDAPVLRRPLWFRADLERIANELLAIGKNNNADLLLVVTKAVCADEIGRTTQPLNGFGLHIRRTAPRRPADAFAPPAESVPGGVAYLCVDTVLYDPRKREVVASRLVLDPKSGRDQIPQQGTGISSGKIFSSPQEEQNMVRGVLNDLASAIAPAIREFLAGGGDK